MAAFPIPVRVIGPGSQPSDEVALDVMPMPQGMNTFEMPRVPERVSAVVMRESAAVLQRMVEALGAWDAGTPGPGPRIALDGLSAAALEVTNQVLGEGEVSIRLATEPAVRIQESVFAGLWCCGELTADGGLARYWLEAGSVPQAVHAAAQAADDEPAAPSVPVTMKNVSYTVDMPASGGDFLDVATRMSAAWA